MTKTAMIACFLQSHLRKNSKIWATLFCILPKNKYLCGQETKDCYAKEK